MSSSAMNQPLINSVGIHAASETKQLSGKHDPLIASGTESKKSWTSVFLVESDHLERITSELLYKQDVLLADFARVLKLKRAKPDVPKGRPAIWTNLKPYILQNREAWDRAISNHGAISFDDELMDTPLKLFGAHIYQLYKSIARDEDLTTVTGNVLKWHPYYESFTDIERIFVVYRYRRFLNRISLDRGLALQRSADTSVGVGEESPSGKPFRACERFLEDHPNPGRRQAGPGGDPGSESDNDIQGDPAAADDSDDEAEALQEGIVGEPRQDVATNDGRPVRSPSEVQALLHHLSAWSPTGIYPAGMALSMEEDSKLALYIERNSLDRILAANIAQSVNSNSGQAQPSFATRKGTHEAFLKVMNTVGRKAGNESEAVAVLRMSFGAEHALVRRNPTPQDSVSPQPHRVDQICFLGWYMSQSFSYGSGLYVDHRS